MVSHGFYIHPVRRNLSASLEVVQLRLSIVIITSTTFVLALSALAIAPCNEPLDEHGEHINFPKSQLDWMVEAARQIHVAGDDESFIGYAKEHDDLVYTVSTTRKGLLRTQITSNRDKSVTLPFLDHYNHHSLQDKSTSDHWGNSAPFVADFDPYSLYENLRRPSANLAPGHGWFSGQKTV